MESQNFLLENRIHRVISALKQPRPQRYHHHVWLSELGLHDIRKTHLVILFSNPVI